MELDINKFIQNFEEQLDDEPVESIKPDTVFKEIDEWDSMIALSIIAMVDEEYNVKITGGEIKEAKTIEDLFDIVNHKK